MNIFNPKKKKEQNMSVAPQLSMAPRQSVYQQPKQSSYQMSNPVSRWGQSVVGGQGNRAIQSSFARPTVQKQPSVQMSRPQQPQQSRVIQGSGMGTRYASNPTNYQQPKPVVPPAPKIEAPAPQDPMQKYLDMLSSRTNQKKAFINEQRAAEEAATKARYGLVGDQIKAQLPVAQNRFNVFKENTLAGVDDIRASGERQKSNTNDYYGEAQRLAAKTLGETRAQDQRTFSNLNTIDSYGEGSFKQANENTTSEFNRFTQQTLKEKAQKLSEIDETVGKAEREATNLIAQEEAKLQEFSQQIQFALMNNDQQMAEELRGLATQSQKLIFDLYDAVDNLKYTADLEKYNIELENTKLQTPDYDAEAKLRGEYFTRTKDNKYNEIAQTYEKILNTPDTAAGDLGLIFSYMKLLDPASTVREGEFANAQNATGVPARVLNAYNNTLTGQRLNPNQRTEFKDAALSYVTPVINQQKQAEDYYKQLALQQGIDPQRVTGGFGTIGVQTTQPQMNSNDPLGLGF